MRLRARDRYISSTLIGGKGGAGPSSLHTTLEGPAESVNARWMWSLHVFLHGVKWIMFHGHLDYFQNPLLRGRPNPKPGDHGTSNVHNHRFILFYHVWGPTWIEIHRSNIWLRARSHMTSHTLEGLWPHYVILTTSCDGLWTLSFRLSQFHGHGSWFMCKVAPRLGRGRESLGRFPGIIKSWSLCFQVQLVTCWHLSVSLH